MRLRVVIFTSLLVFGLFAGVRGVFAAAQEKTTIATVSLVNSYVQHDESGGILINNKDNSSVTLSQNPQISDVTPESTQVATVGWTDANRTSKVRSGQSGTTLVDMWIE